MPSVTPWQQFLARIINSKNFHSINKSIVKSAATVRLKVEITPSCNKFSVVKDFQNLTMQFGSAKITSFFNPFMVFEDEYFGYILECAM